MSEEYVLELEHIRKEYPGVIALKDVSLQLKKGEILALIGENGAGKSTLIKTCSGAVIPTSGKIHINGKTFDRMTPQLAAENGIAIIYQEFNNVGELSAAENLFLGRPIRRGIVIDRKAMNEAAVETFDQLGIKIDPNELVKNLTVGYQQMIEIAKAIQQHAKVLIMDEPSAALTDSEVDNMFKVVRKLQADGVSIIYISHRLEEIFELSDRIEVIRDGEYVDTLITKNATEDQLIKLMVGREMTRKFPERPDYTDMSKTVLELRGVYGNGDKDISLELHKGEVLGLGGLIGAGRTEIAEVIFGAAAKESGQIFLNGEEINPKSPHEAINYGIALVPEDRKRHGVLLGSSVKHNINMPIYERISKFSVINEKIEEETAEKYRQELQIKTPTLDQQVKNLSGGNQQKVVLGKWLAADSQIIIFDEPTRGIDVGAKFEIYKLINELVKDGRSVLMISSEMEELMGMSDRILVLSEGYTAGAFDKTEFNSEAIMAAASKMVK
jgi:ribose transport system ATP-binding protein